MPNKKITEFDFNLNPTINDVIPIVNDGTTKKIALSGLTDFLTFNTKDWLTDANLNINFNETLVISGDYVLENSNLTLSGSNTSVSIGQIIFEKRAKLYIGGNLLLIDSNIINNGMISVSGGIIFQGDSTITGTGIIN